LCHVHRECLTGLYDQEKYNATTISTLPTAVLVQGAFADASGFDAVIGELAALAPHLNAAEPAARLDIRRRCDRQLRHRQ
jgi:hypothetical protein